MMINRDRFKNSPSFKNIEKDLAYVVTKIMENEKLLKLLSLKENQLEALSSEEKKKIMDKCIKIVPKITTIDEKDPWSYVIIVFDDITPNEGNPEYRDKVLYFDIVCHFDTWNMGDFKLRPYQIAGELDKMFDKKALCDSFTANFVATTGLTIDNDISGLIQTYLVTYNISRDKVDE